MGNGGGQNCVQGYRSSWMERHSISSKPSAGVLCRPREMPTRGTAWQGVEVWTRPRRVRTTRGGRIRHDLRRLPHDEDTWPFEDGGYRLQHPARKAGSLLPALQE